MTQGMRWRWGGQAWILELRGDLHRARRLMDMWSEDKREVWEMTLGPPELPASPLAHPGGGGAR